MPKSYAIKSFKSAIGRSVYPSKAINSADRVVSYNGVAKNYTRDVPPAFRHKKSKAKVCNFGTTKSGRCRSKPCKYNISYSGKSCDSGKKAKRGKRASSKTKGGRAASKILQTIRNENPHSYGRARKGVLAQLNAAMKKGVGVERIRQDVKANASQYFTKYVGGVRTTRGKKADMVISTPTAQIIVPSKPLPTIPMDNLASSRVASNVRNTTVSNSRARTQGLIAAKSRLLNKSLARQLN